MLSAEDAAELRRRGNENFRSAKAAKSTLERRKLLWCSLDCYSAALQQLKESRDSSFCWKNSGVMHKELSLLEWRDGNRQRSLHHMRQCVRCYELAVGHSATWATADADGEWRDAAVRQFASDLEAVYSLTLDTETGESFVHELQLLCQRAGQLSSDCPQYLEVAVSIFVDFANRLLHLAVTLHRDQRCADAYRFAAEMHFPIEEAERLCSRNAVLQQSYASELRSLRGDQRIQELIFRSRVELQQGQEFLRNLGSDGGRWMDEALLAIDHLRAALNLIADEGLDIAQEAEICSCIGSAYFSVFKAESAAKKFFGRSLQLVLCFLSDSPRHCRNEAWYATAERGMRQIQQLEAQRCDEERRKELEKDGTIKQIQENFDKGLEAFMTFVYVKHPPPGLQSRPSKSATQKKQIQTAMMHYHPDKVDKSDRRTYWICEEVTKFLNRFHESLVKGS